MGSVRIRAGEHVLQEGRDGLRFLLCVYRRGSILLCLHLRTARTHQSDGRAHDADQKMSSPIWRSLWQFLEDCNIGEPDRRRVAACWPGNTADPAITKELLIKIGIDSGGAMSATAYLSFGLPLD